jgi:hypothetical protein
MQGPTNEAFIPTKDVINGRVVGGTMRRRNGIRTMPVPARAETPALPPPHPPPQLEDEDLPPAKKQRLQVHTSSSTTADGVTTDSPDDTPTDPVTPAASLRSAATSRAPIRNWKPEEDAKLTEAVEKHGKDCWVAVATLVPGRTNEQCRNRWVQTLDPANGNKGKWKPEEDAELTVAVHKHGKVWVTVAAMVSGRTNRQCRNRWVHNLDPANGNKGKWKPEEDAQLTEAVEKHGKEWVTVAAMVSGRTRYQCRQRWVGTLDPAYEKNGVQWTPEEDAKLTEAVEKHGKKWPVVAVLVPGRTGEQCRSRWTRNLDPANGNKGKWASEEDATLIEAVKKLGTECWVSVAAMVSGRTNEQCRQRWVGTLDPNGKKGKWTPEEDTALTEAVNKYGNKWVAVAAMVSGRTNEQCRNRWVQTLDPANGITRGNWKPEEDAKLTEAVEKHGKEWGSVAAMVPGRKSQQCRNRWVQTLDRR